MQDLKVLLFENDLGVAQLLQEVALKYKFQIVVENHLNTPMKVYLQDSPHVVLMDIAMGCVKDGVVAMKELKKEKPSLKVLAMTGYAMVGDKERFLKEGFDDYLAKPFEIEKLIEVLKKWQNN